jgi:GDP-L-fucose synthase
MSNSIGNKILVTGSGGLLGTEIVKCINNNYKDIKLVTPRSFDVDFRSKLETDNLFSTEGDIDTVIHLAAVVFGLKGNMLNQYNALHQNTLIDSNIFDACKQYGVKKIFYASSVAAYGFPFVKIPLIEDDFLVGGPHPGEFGYSMAKRHAHSYLKVLSKYDINCTYGLFTNLYGKHDTYNETTGHVIPSLIYKALEAKKNKNPNLRRLSVWGDGTASRDFMYAKDAARAVLHLLSSSEKGFEMYNIASGVTTKISDIVEILASSLNLYDIDFDISQPTGIQSRSVSVDRLNETGFSCNHSLTSGLNEVLSFLQKK